MIMIIMVMIIMVMIIMVMINMIVVVMPVPMTVAVPFLAQDQHGSAVDHQADESDRDCYVKLGLYRVEKALHAFPAHEQRK